MSKRLVILFFPVPRGGNPQPHPLVLLRCNPESIDDMVERASNHAHPELTSPVGRGKILIGREHERHIQNQDARHPTTIDWEGTQKSGPFATFIRRHSAKHFPQTATA